MKQDEAILFKGTKDGLLVQLRDDVAFDVVRQALIHKLEAHRRFFRKGSTLVSFSGRVLTSEETLEIETILHDRFAEGSLIYAPTAEAAVPIAPPAPLGNAPEWHVPGAVRTEIAVNPYLEPAAAMRVEDLTDTELQLLNAELELTDPDFPPYRRVDAPDTLEEAAYDPSMPIIRLGEPRGYLFIQHTVRNGVLVEHDGDVYIVGDVHEGAHVSATGSITVVGRVRGVVHAGSAGDESAFVVGMDFQPTQLRIAQYFAISPNDDRSRAAVPEMAMLKDGSIVVEPCVFTKPSMTAGKSGKRKR